MLLLYHKIMKVLVQNYTFDPIAKTISFNDYVDISLDGLLLITNVTDNQIIYNFANPSLGGTVLGNVLTLTYDTSTMDALDNLQIFYDNGEAMVPESLIEALYDLTQAMQVIVGTKGNLADLRVQLTSAPVTMSGVGTLDRLTAKGARVIDVSTEPKDLSNLLAMSNINNIQ